MQNKAGVEAKMSSMMKSSSPSPMKIGECACCCMDGGGMSPTEVVGLQTGAWTVDIMKFLGKLLCGCLHPHSRQTKDFVSTPLQGPGLLTTN